MLTARPSLLALGGMLLIPLACGGMIDSDEIGGGGGGFTGGGSNPSIGTGGWFGSGGSVNPPVERELSTLIVEIPEETLSPNEIATELSEFIPDLLIKVESVNAGAGQLLIGSAAGEAQQLCNPTTRVTAWGTSESSFSSGPDDVLLYLVNAGTADSPISPPISVLATLQNLILSDVHIPLEGSRVEGGNLMAMLDIREIYPLFSQIIGVNPDVVCSALDVIGQPCSPCRDGQEFCVAIGATMLRSRDFSGAMSEVPDVPSACLN